MSFFFMALHYILLAHIHKGWAPSPFLTRRSGRRLSGRRNSSGSRFNGSGGRLSGSGSWLTLSGSGNMLSGGGSRHNLRHTENNSAFPRKHEKRCIPVQTVPSPVYPSLQVQVKPPTVLVQAASGEQLSVMAAHSSKSLIIIT